MRSRSKKVKNYLPEPLLASSLSSSQSLSCVLLQVILLSYQDSINMAADFQMEYTTLNDAIGLGSNGAKFDSLGGIISAFLPYILTIAGLILFGMLVFGGFTMLAGAADKESQEKGKKMITSALVGFFIIFLAYWIAQILQVIFKINILS